MHGLQVHGGGPSVGGGSVYSYSSFPSTISGGPHGLHGAPLDDLKESQELNSSHGGGLTLGGPSHALTQAGGSSYFPQGPHQLLVPGVPGDLLITLSEVRSAE